MKIKHLVFMTSVIISTLWLPAMDQLPTHIISLEKSEEILSRIRSARLDLLGEFEGRIYALAGSLDLGRLGQQNIPFRLETAGADHRLETSLNGAFHSYSEVERELFALADSYPELIRIVDIGDSVEGRNIYAAKISDNVYAEENEPEVVFMGCHHAREWISVEIPLLLVRYLGEQYAQNARIRHLVNHSQIWIIPLVNPDGLEFSIYFYRYWRKNMRDNRDGSFGVDLNRNYGYLWGKDNSGSSPDPESYVYRGPAPFSEPETQAVRDFVATHDIRSLVTYHNYSQIIMYPWGHTTESPPDQSLLHDMSARMSQLMEPVNGRFYGYGQAGAALYVTNGDTADWSYGVYGIPSFTIELPPLDQIHGAFYNSETDIMPIFWENLPAMLYLVEWVIQNSSPSDGYTVHDKNRRPDRSVLPKKNSHH
jgi:murein tripeptide amidase MpaA